jgi:hypothetical protein
MRLTSICLRLCGMTRLIRFLAVIAIALSPVWGVQTVDAASSPAPARYPVWPSFLSTGCQAIQGPTGSTTISCADASFLLSQVNSGYACNQLDINISTFNSGHFLATATVNSGSQSNSVSITSSGSYYMQFPGFLVNNLITIQIQAVSAGSMSIASIQTNPCPVATATDTPNPSNTATNTPVPVTGTPTPIATFTPLPSGHNTYTPTVSPTGTLVPATATATGTAIPGFYNCGDVTFPLLNCNFVGNGGSRSVPATFWNLGANTGSVLPLCSTGGGGPFFGVIDGAFGGGLPGDVCDQSVVPSISGDVYVHYQASYFFGNSGPWLWGVNTTLTNLTYGSCEVGSANWCDAVIGTVTGGSSVTFSFLNHSGTTESALFIYIGNIFVSSSADTPTPAPATGTPTPAPGTSTLTPVPSDTDVPIPGAMSTNIPTATECPGGCAVKALTAIPGMATRTMVDTSPFSALTHLSMARSSCAPFGYVQIPYPVITGTPIMGEPLNFGWTVPVTHTWDNTNPLSNTAIQPCAMSEIPSSLWDFTYWFSVFGIATVFIMWLIGLVGRLSGEETING